MPEFAFEKNIDNVKKAVSDLKIGYPVAIDNDYAIWRAFSNQYWPAHYFIDVEGRIRHHHFGESDYEGSERSIQQLLGEAGKTEAWVFSDTDYSLSAGLSVKGAAWHRANDTVGLAGVANGLSRVHQEFFEAGGTGILAGDGALAYGWEKILETYYDCDLSKTVHLAVDYQFVSDPAFNADRGPVSFIGARLHWQF